MAAPENLPCEKYSMLKQNVCSIAFKRHKQMMQKDGRWCQNSCIINCYVAAVRTTLEPHGTRLRTSLAGPLSPNSYPSAPDRGHCRCSHQPYHSGLLHTACQPANCSRWRAMEALLLSSQSRAGHVHESKPPQSPDTSRRKANASRKQGEPFTAHGMPASLRVRGSVRVSEP